MSWCIIGLNIYLAYRLNCWEIIVHLTFIATSTHLLLLLPPPPPLKMNIF